MPEISLIRQLRETKSETLPLFHLKERDLQRSYEQGKWSVRQILHHLADVETVLFERIRRTISEPTPRIEGFDQDAWAEKLHYQARPMELARALYESSRDGNIFYARLHYQRDGHLEFIHSDTGVRTLQQEFDKIAEHNLHHLHQIRRALGAGSPL